MMLNRSNASSVLFFGIVGRNVYTTRGIGHLLRPVDIASSCTVQYQGGHGRSKVTVLNTGTGWSVEADLTATRPKTNNTLFKI